MTPVLPDVAWYKDGEQLDSVKTTVNQQSNGKYSAELEIKSAQYSDTGFYTCMVQNLFGINSGNVTLKVKGNAKDFSLPFLKIISRGRGYRLVLCLLDNLHVQIYGLFTHTSQEK